jgi:L-ascorbate metabolism protein UlaG (beta-lactamase superfamily)
MAVELGGKESTRDATLRSMSLAKVARRAALALALVALTATCLGCCAFSAESWRGPKSDHFDGERFFFPGAPEQQGIAGLWKWQTHREHGPWRDHVDAPPGPPPPRRVGAGDIRITFVNHATVLLQLDGLNVLTDPIWSERCSPVDFAGPRRVRPPGVRFEDLPPIDAILVSHNHYDHLDVPTLKRLRRAFPSARLFAGLGNAAYLAERGLRAEELDWWQSVPLGHGVTLTGVPAQHFSNRGLCDRDGTLFLGYALRGPSGLTYFAGDTGLGTHFAEIRRRLGAPRLAVLPIGAYKPTWFMSAIHLSPAQAVEAHEALGAATSVAIHFGTFDLGDDGQDEAPAELSKSILSRPAPPRFWLLGFGEGRAVP